MLLLLRGDHARLHQLLALVVEREVVQDGGLALEAVEDPQHLDPILHHHLLRIPAIRHGLILIVCQCDVPELVVRYVFDEYPFDLLRGT